MASDGAAGDEFGVSVAISGDVAVVGSFVDSDAGAAYIIERDVVTNQWAQVQQKLLVVAPITAPGDYFGRFVAISGDVAVITAPRVDLAGGNDAGAAYVFVRDAGGQWAQAQKLVASDGAALDQFGVSVAITGDVTLISTAPRSKIRSLGPCS